jgi:LysM repeat protein
MKMKKAVRMPLRRPPQRPRPAAKSPLRARAATAEEYEDDEDYEAEEEPNMKFSHALFVVLVLHIIAVGGVFAFNWMKAKQPADSVAKAPPAAATPAETAATPAAEAPKPVAAKPADDWKGRTHTVAAGDTLTAIAQSHKVSMAAIEKENAITATSMLRVGQVLRIPGTDKSAKTADTPKAPGASTTKEAFLATRTEPAKPATGTLTAVSRPAPESPAAPAEAPAERPEVYVVAKGDNPYTIAKKFHVSYAELLEVNGIKDATKIQIGQKLKIPKD